HVVMRRARDVACAAGAGAGLVDRFMHRGTDVGMLAHADIVVGAPDGDLAAADMIVCARKCTGLAFKIGEHPVATFGPERVETRLEKTFVIHRLSDSTPPAGIIRRNA